MTYMIYQQKQNSGGFLFLCLETFSHRAFQKFTNQICFISVPRTSSVKTIWRLRSSAWCFALCLGSEMNELDISRDHQMGPFFGGIKQCSKSMSILRGPPSISRKSWRLESAIHPPFSPAVGKLDWLTPILWETAFNRMAKNHIALFDSFLLGNMVYVLICIHDFVGVLNSSSGFSSSFLEVSPAGRVTIRIITREKTLEACGRRSNKADWLGPLEISIWGTGEHWDGWRICDGQFGEIQVDGQNGEETHWILKYNWEIWPNIYPPYPVWSYLRRMMLYVTFNVFFFWRNHLGHILHVNSSKLIPTDSQRAIASSNMIYLKACRWFKPWNKNVFWG